MKMIFFLKLKIQRCFVCLIDFGCKKGSAFDADSVNCKECPAGTFSLGGGAQYTFTSDDDLVKKYSELTFKGSPLFGSSTSNCRTKE